MANYSNKLAKPLAPLPLQELHHCYGLACPWTTHQFTAFRLFLLCVYLALLYRLLTLSFDWDFNENIPTWPLADLRYAAVLDCL
jgi:hypothetical protein